MPFFSTPISTPSVPQEYVVSEPVKEVKVEGTSRTYGQDITIVAESTNTAQTPPTTQNIAEGNPTATKISDETSDRETEIVDIKSPVVVPSPPIQPMPGVTIPPAPVQPSLVTPVVEAPFSVLVSPTIVPSDTEVKIIQRTNELIEAVNEFGAITSLSCKAQSNIAVAAASTNAGATAVVSKGAFFDTEPVDLVASILTSVATVTPNVEQVAIVHGSSVKTKEDIKEALVEAQKSRFSYLFDITTF